MHARFAAEVIGLALWRKSDVPPEQPGIVVPCGHVVTVFRCGASIYGEVLHMARV
jgi:hypothetical protein